MFVVITGAWRYRGFITSSVINDFKARLSRTRFGAAWIVLQPLAQVLIFASILSNVLAARLPGNQSKYGYVVYLMAGTACWSLFTEIVQRCVTVFIDNGTLLKKIKFPRIALPAVVVGIASINNLVYLAVVLLLLPFLAVYPGVHYLWLPVLMAMTIGLASGIGLFSGTLNVFARDIGQVVSVVLQFWFWMTPIVYPVAIVPDRIQVDIGSQSGAAAGRWLSKRSALQNGAACPTGVVRMLVALLLAGAVFIFRRASAEIVDVL